MPFELSEYMRGQLFAVSEVSKLETGGGDGVEVCLVFALLFFCVLRSNRPFWCQVFPKAHEFTVHIL